MRDGTLTERGKAGNVAENSSTGLWMHTSRIECLPNVSAAPVPRSVSVFDQEIA